MSFKTIQSHSELLQNLPQGKKSYLLLTRTGSPTAGCAEKSIAEAAEGLGVNTLLADVAEVREIHPKYGVDSIPTLLVFEGQDLKNVVKGCQGTAFYKNLFTAVTSTESGSGAGQPRVTVYSTPTCPWCTTLKNYLRTNGIRFTDVDVSIDQQKARELVNKSGQTGVPQTEINGQMVVGFDKAKLNRLLNING